MAKRLLRGETLFHPDDARYEDSIPTNINRLTYSGSKRISLVKKKTPGKPHEWRSQDIVKCYVMTGRQWQVIKKMIPLRHGLNQRQKEVQYKQHRNAINGMFYVIYRNSKWEQMPKRYCYFGSNSNRCGHVVYRVWHRWRTQGLWIKMLRAAGLADPANRIQWHKMKKVAVQAG